MYIIGVEAIEVKGGVGGRVEGGHYFHSWIIGEGYRMVRFVIHSSAIVADVISHVLFIFSHFSKNNFTIKFDLQVTRTRGLVCMTTF